MPPALVRARDPELTAVLGHGPAGDPVTGGLERLHEGLVGERRGGILRCDELLDLLADRVDGGDPEGLQKG